MIALDIHTPKIRKLHTAENRDSSALLSRRGYVIHSAVHRSTAFVCGENHPEGFASLVYWIKAGQAASNAWIVATVSDASLEDCNLAAIRAAFPDWKFHRVNSCGVSLVTGTKGPERVSETTWEGLHAKLK